jgi:hypothetical protein
VAGRGVSPSRVTHVSVPAGVPVPEPSAARSSLAERRSGGLAAVDTVAPTDWSYEDADEHRSWVGMRGWYY